MVENTKTLLYSKSHQFAKIPLTNPLSAAMHLHNPLLSLTPLLQLMIHNTVLLLITTATATTSIIITIIIPIIIIVITIIIILFNILHIILNLV